MKGAILRLWSLLLFIQMILGLGNLWHMPRLPKCVAVLSLVYNVLMSSIMFCYALLSSLCRPIDLQTQITDVAFEIMHLSWAWAVSCYYLFNMFTCFGSSLKQVYVGLQTYLKYSHDYYPVLYGTQRKIRICLIVLLSAIAILFFSVLTHSYYELITTFIPIISVKIFMTYIYHCWNFEGNMLDVAYAGYFILSTIGPVAIFANVMFTVCTIISLCEELTKIKR